jgi:ABC-type sugar transport system ATPase subunit
MIRIEALAFRIGSFRLQDIHLQVAAGEYFVLMGPPGSGKSVLLECICGLKQPEQGKVFIGEREVTHLEPRARAIGYVPQDYALFPHRSVAENIAFGLRRQGCSAQQIRQKVAETAALLGIEHLLARSVAGLSGGEQQRVALGRAIVLEPQALLLDEPVSALDEATRRVICGELLTLQRRLGIPTIHVCHNREEAFAVADRAAIIHEGAIQQCGPMPELLRKSRNEFVASFMCCENLLEGTATTSPHSNGTLLQVEGVTLLVAQRVVGKVKFIIRPENVRLAPAAASAPSDHNRFPVTVAQVLDCGAYARVELNGSLPLVSYVAQATMAELGLRPAQELTAIIAPADIHLLEG